MKKQIKGFIIGFISCAIITASFPGIAATIKKKIDVELNSVTVNVNSKAIAKDSIIYNGKVYVNAQSISNSLNKAYAWDKLKKIVTIKDKPTPTPTPVIIYKSSIQTVSYDNGTYCGDIDENGVKNGFGTYEWNNGETYKGEWEDNNRTGFGDYFWFNGDRYVGEFNNNEPNGKGIYYFNNGDIYVGNFKNNSFDGYGTYIYDNGNAVSGYWVDGKFQQAVSTPSPTPKPAVTPTPRPTQAPTATPVTTTTPDLSIKGPLKLYSNDGKNIYLGKLTSNKYDTESVFNEYGTYGSKYATNSIWNTYGTYGSKYSLYSAFNEYSTYPPYIKDGDGVKIGYVSANKNLYGAVSPSGLYDFLKYIGF